MNDKSENLTRSLNAKLVLENPEFKAALNDSRLALLDAIGSTKPKDTEFREFLYQMVQVLPFVEMALNARLNGGIDELKIYLDKQKLDDPKRGE